MYVDKECSVVTRPCDDGLANCVASIGSTFFIPATSAKAVFFNLRAALGSPLTPDFRITKKFWLLNRIIRSSQVGVFVEVHGKHFNQLALELEWPEHFVFLSKHPISEDSGGVLVTIERKWAITHFGKGPSFKSIEPGRIVVAELRGSDGGLDILGVHLEPALGPLAKRSIFSLVLLKELQISALPSPFWEAT